MTVQCCKCKRVRVAGRWGAHSCHAAEIVSHTYCPTCADEFRIELFSTVASEAQPHSALALTRLLTRAPISAA